MSSANRTVIKVEPKPETAAGWLAKAKSVNTTATANVSTFASIAALLTQLGTDTELLDAAQSKVANKGKTDTKARNAQWRVLQKSLRAFAAGVQGLCDGAIDVAHAQALAAAAGLDTKVSPVRVMADFRGKALGNGQVRLYGRRPVARRTGAFFEWSMSTDGGKTWVTIATTNTAKTLVAGLTAATSVSFRYRSTLKNVTSEWSQTISVLVH
jgi:hypothetical protein